MATNEEMKSMLNKMENVLEQAIELKEENRQLKIENIKLKESTEGLDRDMNDFRRKLELFSPSAKEGEGELNESSSRK